MKVIFETVDNYTVQTNHGDFLINRTPNTPKEWAIIFPEKSLDADGTAASFGAALRVVIEELTICNLYEALNLTEN